ncbi:histidine phosphatase family protein [Rummeliibacillus sp. SL167]|uniref:histidine phosphatase family protein n=1 Tax=Rummeliibacillus sp. SL167 TaxID=2579792 RepID=UPI0011B4B7A9|nr:histidine phosphatase family protein [Rummeliibacillus sp. SL167]
MTKIYIVRHGETDWNREGRLQGGRNTALNKRGEKQAIACRSYFEKIKCDAIFTSTLNRASHTATIMNETLQLPFHALKEFAERTYGEAEGMTYEERRRAYPHKEYPNQETVEELKKRIVSGLQMIDNRYSDGSVILVTHGAVIHTLFTMVENASIFPQSVRLSNGGVSTIYNADGKWWLDKYNEIHHLNNHSDGII